MTVVAPLLLLSPLLRSGTVSDTASRCRREAVTSHHVGQSGGIGWAADRGLDDGGDFAEVGRAEDARCDDREHLRVDAVRVVEAVNRPATYTQHLTCADIHLPSVHRPRQHALET